MKQTDMPGGRLMGEIEIMNPSLLKFQNDLYSQTGALPWEIPYLYDEAFLSELIKLPEASKYVIETLKHSRSEPSNKDYVLVFRRTTPQDSGAKPEKHWGLEYLQIRNGLSREIVGEEREKSRIYVSTIGLLESTSGRDIEIGGFTDGEIQIGDNPLDLSKVAIFSVKPSNDSEELTV